MATPVNAKLQLFVVSDSRMVAAPNVPLQLSAEFKFLTDDPEPRRFRAVLQSDHVGYAAFDFEGVRLGDQPRVDSIEIKVFPFFDEEQAIAFDGLSVTWAEPNPNPISVEVPREFVQARKTYPSIESADARDWRASPLSFGTRVFASEETGPCAPFLPTGAPTFTSLFSEIAIEPSQQLSTLEPRKPLSACERYFDVGDAPALCYKVGRLIEYETTWNPINHGLGEILHSMTLAPCEQVNFAVIDWKRRDQSARTEDQRVDEALEHDLRRDRTIEEVVEGAVSETQRGRSFLGGTAGTGGYGSQGGGGSSGGESGGAGGPLGGLGGLGGGGGGGGSPFGFGIFGSHALGIGRSRSSGSRDTEVETTQTLNDNIVQSANSVRRLRGTVVVQSNQSEAENIQTRTVRNHNHCHALTVLFYEIVRHFHVVTRAVREREVILIKNAALPGQYIERFSFEQLSVLRFRLEPALLDRRLSGGFEAIDELGLVGSGRREEGGVGLEGSRTDLVRFVKIELQGSDSPSVITTVSVLDVDEDEIGVSRNSAEAPWTAEIVHDLGQDFELERLLRVIISYNRPRGEDRRSAITLTHVRISARAEGDAEWTLLVDAEESAERSYALPTTLSTGGRFELPIPLTNDQRTVVRSSVAARLLAHVNANALHYNRALWLTEDPDERVRRLERYLFRGGRLTDFIERDLIAVHGDYLVFASSEARKITSTVASVCEGGFASPVECTLVDIPAPPPVESIIALPTRGAFAETKLSECNSCEVIDPTRFWKWQEAPCLDDAPSISPVEAASRSEPSDVNLSEFPAPIINIANAPPAPNPTGLTDALALLRTPEVFRDMSAVEQLGPLLQTLAEVAGGTASTITSAARSAHERNQVVRDSVRRGEIDQETGEELIEENLRRSATPNPTEQPEPDEDPRPSPSPSPDPEPDPDPVPEVDPIIEMRLALTSLIVSRETMTMRGALGGITRSGTVIQLQSFRYNGNAVSTGSFDIPGIEVGDILDFANPTGANAMFRSVRPIPSLEELRDIDASVVMQGVGAGADGFNQHHVDFTIADFGTVRFSNPFRNVLGAFQIRSTGTITSVRPFSL